MKRWVLIAVLVLVLVLAGAGGYWGVTGINPARKAGDVVVRLGTSEQAKVDKLQAEVAAALQLLIDDLASAGLETYVGQTLRTKAEEKAAVDSEHSAVTTHSWHELGRAVDLYPINPDTGHWDSAGARVDLYQQMVAAAEARGFTSLAFNDDGTKRILHTKTGHAFWDGGHLEFHGPYASIAAAVAAEGSEYGIA